MAVNYERPSMNDIYAMQRANGDWFAFEDHGRFRVPLFHSSHDAMMARLRNFGMLLFKPVALDARLLAEIVAVRGGRDVDLCMVNDPCVSLSRGSLVAYAELVLLLNKSVGRTTIPRNGNGFHLSGLSMSPQSEWWN